MTEKEKFLNHEKILLRGLTKFKKFINADRIFQKSRNESIYPIRTGTNSGDRRKFASKSKSCSSFKFILEKNILLNLWKKKHCQKSFTVHPIAIYMYFFRGTDENLQYRTMIIVTDKMLRK